MKDEFSQTVISVHMAEARHKNGATIDISRVRMWGVAGFVQIVGMLQ